VSSERLESLRTALDRLPEDQREVLILRHVAGLTPGDIADALDRTESSVRGLHHRGRVALKAALRELGAAPVTAAA
jgi:RNA polymerase sigma-70 factor, ECF subfamily